jgi:hypothetical protein
VTVLPRSQQIGLIQAALIRAALEEMRLTSADDQVFSRLARTTVGLRRGDLLALIRSQALTAADLLTKLEADHQGASQSILEAIADPAAALDRAVFGES